MPEYSYPEKEKYSLSIKTTPASGKVVVEKASPVFILIALFVRAPLLAIASFVLWAVFFYGNLYVLATFVKSKCIRGAPKSCRGAKDLPCMGFSMPIVSPIYITLRS